MGQARWALFGFGAYELGTKVSKFASGLTLVFLSIAVVAGLLVVKLFLRYESPLRRDAKSKEML